MSPAVRTGPARAGRCSEKGSLAGIGLSDSLLLRGARNQPHCAAAPPIPLFERRSCLIMIGLAVIDRIALLRCGTMPKQKTHKGTKKRFRLTARGKVVHRQSGTSHLAARMSHKRKRNLRGTTVVDATEADKIREMLCGRSY